MHKFKKPKGSADLCFVLGAWLADGYVGEYTASLEKDDEVFVTAVYRALERLGFPGVAPIVAHRLRTGTMMYRITISAMKVCDFLRPYKYGQKAFTSMFWKYPVDFTCGFFSGDGSATYRADGEIVLSMSNKRWDILSTIRRYAEEDLGLRPTRIVANSQGCYQFSINYRADVKKFLEVISPFKKQLYEEYYGAEKEVM